MSDDWYIYKSNKAQGPLSESQVRGALAAGRIKPDTPLRRGLSGPWTPAERALAESVPATPARRKRSAPASGEINVVIEKPSRLPLALAAVAGVVVLIGVLWGAFELGRRQQGPAVLAAHQDQATAGQTASVTLVDKAQPNTTLPNAPAATQSAIKPPASQTLAGDESDPAKSPPTTAPAALPPTASIRQAQPSDTPREQQQRRLACGRSTSGSRRQIESRIRGLSARAGHSRARQAVAETAEARHFRQARAARGQCVADRQIAAHPRDSA
jgi:hypothetical protein